ncbi:hypothetical protein COUCH_24325 [Couchioplanes caeruleus]|uniref:hypothetical protein n=1 Tax=Couchioplanes caeruleus TaxID=56438 RepID=UPI0020BE9074|nr:hypothetical protein [Couchioplanes caeruleus]UQU62160.1 hypothetical protein COUCH_24325 [Couchioplanes caeruleus]
MTALEDPGSSGEDPGPNPSGDELEGWLSDLRTDVAAAPSAWIGEESAGKPVEDGTPDPRRTGTAGRSGGGRHRAAD